MKRKIYISKKIFFSMILVSFATLAVAQMDSAVNLPNFLLPRFTQSVVKFKSGSSKTAVLNYNVVDQDMVFRQDDHYMVLDNPQLIDTVYMANRVFVPFETGFYELVMAGPVTLFIQHKSNLETVGTSTGYGATTQTTHAVSQRQIYGPGGTIDLRIPDDLKVVDDNCYWIRRGGSMDKFTNKRQLLKILKDKEKELNKFFDSNSISFRNLSDIVKLFNYCNELYN